MSRQRQLAKSRNTIASEYRPEIGLTLSILQLNQHMIRHHFGAGSNRVGICPFVLHQHFFHAVERIFTAGFDQQFAFLLILGNRFNPPVKNLRFGDRLKPVAGSRDHLQCGFLNTGFFHNRGTLRRHVRRHRLSRRTGNSRFNGFRNSSFFGRRCNGRTGAV